MKMIISLVWKHDTFRLEISSTRSTMAALSFRNLILL